VALFLSQANLSIVGQALIWGREYDLPPDDPEVVACAGKGYLIARAEDGTYPAPAKVEPARGCCGG
jgi:hypothetical protein